MGNVLINGRTAVHAGSGGTLTTIDACWTKVDKPVVFRRREAWNAA